MSGITADKLQLFGGFTMSYSCEVKEQPTQKTLSIRTRAAVQDLPRLLEAGYGAIV